MIKLIGISILSTTMLLILLKMFAIISWSWLWVLGLLWIPVIVSTILCVVIAMTFGLGSVLLLLGYLFYELRESFTNGKRN